jgi:hypothetical protein
VWWNSLVCVSKVDDTISWRAFGGIDYWCCTFFGYKTPEYKKPTKYDWEKPDFNSAEDKFMQRFDEKNFVNLVVEEEGSEDPEVIQTYFTSESKVAYSIVATNKRGQMQNRNSFISYKKRTITRESDVL